MLTGGTINILTCGSVDDGKSTLIGRLLWDASDLPDDTRDMVRRSARAKGDGELLDFSLLCDGLIAERERACDEAVLETGTAPHSYAEGLLKVCRFRLQPQLPCVAGAPCHGRVCHRRAC